MSADMLGKKIFPCKYSHGQKIWQQKWMVFSFDAGRSLCQTLNDKATWSQKINNLVWG